MNKGFHFSEMADNLINKTQAKHKELNWVNDNVSPVKAQVNLSIKKVAFTAVT